MLVGKTFTNSSTVGATGTMPNHGDLNWKPASSTTQTVQPGYYSGGTLDSSAAYSKGMDDADARVNKDSASYKQLIEDFEIASIYNYSEILGSSTVSFIIQLHKGEKILKTVASNDKNMSPYENSFTIKSNNEYLYVIRGSYNDRSSETPINSILLSKGTYQYIGGVPVVAKYQSSFGYASIGVFKVIDAAGATVTTAGNDHTNGVGYLEIYREE